MSRKDNKKYSLDDAYQPNLAMSVVCSHFLGNPNLATAAGRGPGPARTSRVTVHPSRSRAAAEPGLQWFKLNSLFPPSLLASLPSAHRLVRHYTQFCSDGHGHVTQSRGPARPAGGGVRGHRQPQADRVTLLGAGGSLSTS